MTDARTAVLEWLKDKPTVASAVDSYGLAELLDAYAADLREDAETYRQERDEIAAAAKAMYEARTR